MRAGAFGAAFAYYFRAADVAVEVDIPLGLHFNAVLSHIASGGEGRTDGFQLCFHRSYYDERAHQSHDKRRHEPREVKKSASLRAVVVVAVIDIVRTAVFRRGYVFVRFGDERAEPAVVVPVREISLYVVKQGVYSVVRERRDSESAGGYVKVARVHCHNKDYTVPVFPVTVAVVVVVIVGVSHNGAVPVHVFGGVYYTVKALSFANLVKSRQHLVVLV